MYDNVIGVENKMNPNSRAHHGETNEVDDEEDDFPTGGCDE